MTGEGKKDSELRANGLTETLCNEWLDFQVSFSLLTPRKFIPKQEIEGSSLEKVHCAR